jgi:hypothetical protein
MSDTHAMLVAAGRLRRGQDAADVARATGLTEAEVIAIAHRLARADRLAAGGAA